MIKIYIKSSHILFVQSLWMLPWFVVISVMDFWKIILSYELLYFIEYKGIVELSLYHITLSRLKDPMEIWLSNDYFST